MAFASGILSTPTATGNFSVSGLSFQPKYVRFFSTNQSDGALGGDALMMEGATDGTRQWAHAMRGQDNAATTVCTVGRTDAVCISIPSLTATPLFEAAVVSLDSDGFTLNATVVDGASHSVAWYAEGGPDILDVRVDTFDTGSGTGEVTVSTPGFKSTLVHLCLARRVDSTIDAYSTAAHASFGHGAFNDEGQQFSIAGLMQNAAAAEDAGHMGASDSCLVSLTDAAGALFLRLTYVAMTASGFTLNRVLNAASVGVGYIALRRASKTRIGKFTTLGTTGIQSITGLGLLGEQVWFSTVRAGDTSATPATAGAFLTIGYMSKAVQFVFGIGAVDAADPTTQGAFLATSKCLRYIDGTPATLMEAGYSFLDLDRLAVDWTTSDGIATRVIFFIALGPPPSRYAFAPHPKPIIGDLIARTGRA